MAQNTVHIQLTSLPEYHPMGSNIYVAGSFNGWKPQDESFKFRRDNKGAYYIDLDLPDGSYEYKITRGTWDKSECEKDGDPVANHQLVVPGITSVNLIIEEWVDRFPPKQIRSTATRNVKIIDTAFLIPQLKRTRRVWIYLPTDYTKSARKKYPVIYMQDGQNLFDNATAYSGEWGIDEYLDSIKNQCIIVGIDHGNEKRMNEYNPYDNNKFGKGEGKSYGEFLVKVLKPYIDKRYRTLKRKNNTFIAGSSMGGLISLYTTLCYPKVFGGAGIFSPAFWVGGSQLFTDIKKQGKKVNSLIYFYGGKQEGETMVPDMLKAFKEMSAVSKSKMVTVIRDEGKHNEPTWRKEFPLFYQWVMGAN